MNQTIPMMTSSSTIAPSTGPARPSKLAIPPNSAASSPCSAVSSGSGAPTPTSTHHSQLAAKLATGASQNLSMISEAVAPSQPPKTSITSKEWVIPPRPKPGRKPATDTPPTKRKAQNRAAQRAFRERRAARVGELEEQMDEQRDHYEHIQLELREKANGLEIEVQSLRGRCSMLEDMLQKERTERSRLSNEVEIMRSRWTADSTSASSRNDSLPALQAAISQHQTPRSSITSNYSLHKNSTASLSISNIISPQNPSDSDNMTSAGCGSCDPSGSCACVDELLAATGPSIDCGKCSLGTRCECLESLPSLLSIQEPDLKRRPPSCSDDAPDEKRQKSNTSENEIDFTAMFSRKPQAVVDEPVVEPYQPAPRSVVIPPRDSCGFCTEGTYCMCAEAAAAASQQTLAPMGSQVQTPPPSENDVVPPTMEFTSTGAVKLPRLQSLNRPNSTQSAAKINGCGVNGPGTCAQCLADPKSGLFCRSLAARFANEAGSAKSGEGCCGGSAGGGCCKAKKEPPPSSSLKPSSGLALSLPCADAYKTLSSHQNFEKAADNIDAWLPKLKAKPTPQEVGESSRARRLPIEVEAASIMSVLKDFDVRFGRGA